jgi:D-lactate dehydrogenase (cytochrome)
MLSGPQHDPKALKAALAQLRATFGERLTEAESVRVQHGNQLSEVSNQPPDAVIFPETTDEVAEAVRVCAAHRVPIIPFGVGSSFEGHVNAPFGGLSIDTSRMKRIIAVHADDLDCVIEAGVTRTELNRHLRDSGLFFPIDPGADASLGGMAATRASGTNAVRYGTMKDNVLALTIVLPDGRIARTGTRARKSSAGYDLTRLIVGSEGTLAVITEITLRLAGIPEEISGGVCPFPSVEAACQAVITTIQAGIPVARIELMDELHVHACNVHSKLDLPETSLLFLEFHGSAAGVAEHSAVLARLPPNAAAVLSSGQQSRKSAPASGWRAITPIGRAERCGLRPKAFRPMSACRFRSSRSALPKPKRISPRAGSSRRSSGTSATVIFT